MKGEAKWAIMDVKDVKGSRSDLNCVVDINVGNQRLVLWLAVMTGAVGSWCKSVDDLIQALFDGFHLSISIVSIYGLSCNGWMYKSFHFGLI